MNIRDARKIAALLTDDWRSGDFAERLNATFPAFCFGRRGSVRRRTPVEIRRRAREAAKLEAYHREMDLQCRRRRARLRREAKRAREAEAAMMRTVTPVQKRWIRELIAERSRAVDPETLEKLIIERTEGVTLP